MIRLLKIVSIYKSTYSLIQCLLDAHIVFWVQFNNNKFQRKRLTNFPLLPDVNGATFFRVNIKKLTSF